MRVFRIERPAGPPPPPPLVCTNPYVLSAVRARIDDIYSFYSFLQLPRRSGRLRQAPDRLNL